MVNPYSKLNITDYKPAPYRPLLGADTFHNLAIRPANNIVIPAVANDWEKYWIGLLVVPCVLLFLFILWLFSLCLSGCCISYRKRNRYRGFIFFMVFGTLAFFFYIPVLVYNVKTEESIDGIVNTIELLNTWIGDVVLLADDVDTKTLADIISLNNNIYNGCLGTVNAISKHFGQGEVIDNYPYDDINSVATDAQLNIQDTVIVLLGGIQDGLEGIVDTLDRYRFIRPLVIDILAGFMMVSTFFFLFATALNFLDAREGMLKQIKLCLARSSCVTVFSIGMLFLSLTMLLIVIIELLATVSSDICVPGPDENLQRLLAQAAGTQILDTSDECKVSPTLTIYNKNGYEPNLANNPNFITEINAPTPEAAILCYYQTCAGNNEFYDILAQVVDDKDLIVGEINNVSKQLEELLDIPGLSEENKTSISQCVAAVGDTTSLVNNLSDNIVDLAGLLSCGRINPIYVGFFHKGLCNNALEDTISLWAWFIAACFMLMIVMFVHRVFKLDYPEDHYDQKDAENTSSIHENNAASQGIPLAETEAGKHITYA